MMRITGMGFLACTLIFNSAGAFGASAADTPVDWQTLLPEVRSAVKHSFPKETSEAHYPASISKTADLTGAGGSEALVDLGTGAYTEEMTVVRIEAGQPVVAKFRGKDDKVSPMVFLSGISEGKGEAVELRPMEHVVYSGHWFVDGAKMKHCGGEAYRWEASAKNFEYDKKLSKSMTHEFCQKMGLKMQATILRGE